MEIDINKCIKYVAHAWDNVTNTTIENCWMKANILPNDDDDEDHVNAELQDHNANIRLEIQCLKELEEVQLL